MPIKSRILIAIFLVVIIIGVVVSYEAGYSFGKSAGYNRGYVNAQFEQFIQSRTLIPLSPSESFSTGSDLFIKNGSYIVSSIISFVVECPENPCTLGNNSVSFTILSNGAIPLLSTSYVQSYDSNFTYHFVGGVSLSVTHSLSITLSARRNNTYALFGEIDFRFFITYLLIQGERA